MNLPWNRFFIHASLLKETQNLLLSFWDGDEPREGLVYWGGRLSGKDLIALTAFAPDAEAEPLRVTASEAANTEFARSLHGLELTYLAQVHSHPPEVEAHSPGDDTWAFMKHNGLVSIVAQDYGRPPLWPLQAVHVFFQERFVRLELREIRERFAVIPAAVKLRKEDTA